MGHRHAQRDDWVRRRGGTVSARPGQPPRQTPGSQTSHLHTLRTHPLSTLPRPWRFVKAAGAGSAVTFSEKGRASAGVTGYVKTRLRRIRVGPEPGTGVLIRRGETHTERPRLPRCSHKPLGAGPQELEGAGRTLPWSLPRLLTALLGHEAGSEAGPVDCVTVSPCDFPGKLCLWRGRTALVLKT